MNLFDRDKPPPIGVLPLPAGPDRSGGVHSTSSFKCQTPPPMFRRHQGFLRQVCAGLPFVHESPSPQK